METMGHRERVLTALQHREPDRLPLDLWGSAYSLNDGIYFATKSFLGIAGEIEPWRRGRLGNYYDERILNRFDIDFRHVWLCSRTDFKPQVFSDGSYIDEWGVSYRPQSGFVGVVDHPLANASLADLARFPWPPAGAPGRTAGVRERASTVRTTTDFALVARSATPAGLFDIACDLRGTERFLMDLINDKPFAHRLLDRIMGFELDLHDCYLREAGEYLDIVCWAEDYGHQTGLLISPRMYREFFQPRHARIIDFVKKRAPNARFQFHSCGSIRRLIPDLVDIGVDILQSVQPLASGMNAFELKQEFGDRLCFHGGIDIQHALPGTLADINADVRRAIQALAPAGGYILAPSNNVQDDTPPENLVHMYDSARIYGQYPIQLA